MDLLEVPNCQSFSFGPELGRCVNSVHAQVSGSQQRSIPVAYLHLQLRVAAEMAQMITRKSMPRRILRPGVRGGSPPRCAAQLPPVSQPVRRAYPFTFSSPVCPQNPQQRLVNRHPPCTARLAVLRQNINRPLPQIHLCPGKPRHLVRTDTGVQHHSHCRRATAILITRRSLSHAPFSFPQSLLLSLLPQILA